MTMPHLVKVKRSLSISADVPTLKELRRLVVQTFDHPAVSSYKVGLRLVIPYGLGTVVDIIRRTTKKPIIYDMQKAATDIPDMAVPFADACVEAGVTSVILFPLAGPKTEEAFITACLDRDLHVMVGGEMTHKSFLDTEGGWIRADRIDDIYKKAYEMGIRDFVAPGTKPERIKHYRELLGPEAVLFSPGLVTQGGDMKAARDAAGDSWHAIVGRAIYQNPDPLQVLDDLAEQLNQ